MLYQERVLDLLENKGLIYKQVDENDRRSSLVYIEDKGRKLIDETISIEQSSTTRDETMDAILLGIDA